MLENTEFWSKSNYSHVEHLECHMEVNMELNEGEQMIDHAEASRYELFSNGEIYKGGCRWNWIVVNFFIAHWISNVYLVIYKKMVMAFADLQNQSRTSNLDNEHFPRDASNHANVEATGPPYDLSNGMYLQGKTYILWLETQMNTRMLFSSSGVYFMC